ncbi:alpha/beta fold hydrolase [Vibrio cholerae]|uniref:alpha/beta fold hydrolase n=1 Tax=Vibrio cholerae TaxID=666 RepID=UPI00226F58FE|nr:alpha/beta fold hydrolase [Vibrio cholerae]MCX9513474.1 alpha/beta fold hydrolase [Vibrio cholerae]MCX9516519.1 alpha/beta fold hydrolase [Vibrio cholerae]
MRKFLKNIALFKVVLLAVLALSIWSTRIPDMPYHQVTPELSRSDFHVIEFNDEGEMHLPGQYEMLKARLAKNPGAELLIFIHGWHHNAAPTDDNFVAFQRFHRQMAKTNPGLIGLYIGWRGDQYDPLWLDGSDDPESRVEALDFPTILTSKQVARRVGEHGVRKLLSSLDELHRQGTLGRYILVGHSLGGVVALHARKQAILDNLAAGRGETHLTVLLNPAASAKEYQPLDKWLSPEGFGPSMLVLQSKTDFAVREAFNWIKDGERAVGNSWAITHDVDPCSGRDCNKVVKIPQWLLEHDAKPGCMQVLEGAGWKIRARLHARKTVQSCEDANRQAVWVLAVADGVIAGHNGILTDDQALALNAWMKSKLAAATEVVPAEAVAEPSVISPHLSDEPVLPSMENIPTEVATEPLSSAVELEPQESESAVPAISEPTLEAPLVAQPEERAPQ